MPFATTLSKHDFSMTIPLEDTFIDVVKKAQRGLAVDDVALAQRSGFTLEDIESAKPSALRAAAAVLGLKAEALVALSAGFYTPADLAITGLQSFNTPFEDMTVNAYLVWDPASSKAAVFDTGSDCSGILAAVKQMQLSVEAIYLTHTHGDHIFDLDRLVEKTHATAYVSQYEPLQGATPFAEGQTFSIGALHIATHRTWGHSLGGTTFVVSGLEKPIAIVGDAIFCSSMGGGQVSYADALRTNRENILTLSRGTILCPGHGPLTTVAAEWENNPFFP